MEDATQQLGQDLKQIQENHEEPISIEKYQELGDYDALSILQTSGRTWNDIKEEHGLRTNMSRNKVTREDIIEDLQRIHEETGKALHVSLYIENGENHINTLRRRFSGFEEACNQAEVPYEEKRGAGTSPLYDFTEERVERNKKILEIIGDVHSRYTLEELKQIVEENSELETNKKEINAFAQWVMEERDDAYASVSNCKKNGSRIFLKTADLDWKQRYPDIFSKLDESLHYWIIEGISEGHSPSGTAAAVYYLSNRDVTQDEAGDEFGSTPVTVRNLKQNILSKLGEDKGKEYFPL